MHTIEEKIKYHIKELRSLELYFYSDNRSAKFFEDNPLNTDELLVNEKISALNSGLIDSSDVPALAQQIISLPIDEAMRNGQLLVIENMIDFRNQSGIPALKHFCSLYCNFHYPTVYPVISPNSIQLISLLQEKNISVLKDQLDLSNYQEFKVALDKIISEYELGDMNYHEVDKFLWVNASRIKQFINTL